MKLKYSFWINYLLGMINLIFSIKAFHKSSYTWFAILFIMGILNIIIWFNMMKLEGYKND